MRTLIVADRPQRGPKYLGGVRWLGRAPGSPPRLAHTSRAISRFPSLLKARGSRLFLPQVLERSRIPSRNASWTNLPGRCFICYQLSETSLRSISRRALQSAASSLSVQRSSNCSSLISMIEHPSTVFQVSPSGKTTIVCVFGMVVLYLLSCPCQASRTAESIFICRRMIVSRSAFASL